MGHVGIMSMQRILNYGSTLQAFALRRLVESVDPTATVRFVDYRPGPTLVAPPGRRSPQNHLTRTVVKLREYAAIEAGFADRLRFLNHKRRYAARNFPTVGVPMTPDYDLDLDLQIVGSDEVFNCIQSNTRVGWSRDLFGHASPATRLVTYAASFGNTTLRRIEEFGIADALRADLSGFEQMSVRDANSAYIVESLTGGRPNINVDPVLAYDLMALEPRVPKHRLHHAPYVVVYAYPGRLSVQENRLIREYAERRGLRVLAFGGPQACADRFVDCDPFALLAWFRDAEAVVTDTFHGSIFAMINHRPFAALVRASSAGGYGNEEKLSHLLQTFGVSDRAVIDLANLAPVMDQPLDDNLIETTLATERMRTNNYLRVALCVPDESLSTCGDSQPLPGPFAERLRHEP